MKTCENNDTSCISFVQMIYSAEVTQLNLKCHFLCVETHTEPTTSLVLQQCSLLHATLVRNQLEATHSQCPGCHLRINLSPLSLSLTRTSHTHNALLASNPWLVAYKREPPHKTSRRAPSWVDVIVWRRKLSVMI